MTYPYNDDVMVYDYDKHRYFLTEKGVLSELGISYGTAGENIAAGYSSSQSVME